MGEVQEYKGTDDVEEAFRAVPAEAAKVRTDRFEAFSPQRPSRIERSVEFDHGAAGVRGIFEGRLAGKRSADCSDGLASLIRARARPRGSSEATTRRSRSRATRLAPLAAGRVPPEYKGTDDVEEAFRAAVAEAAKVRTDRLEAVFASTTIADRKERRFRARGG